MAAPPQVPGPQTLLPLLKSQLHSLLSEALSQLDQLDDLGEALQAPDKGTTPTIADTPIVAPPESPLSLTTAPMKLHVRSASMNENGTLLWNTSLQQSLSDAGLLEVAYGLVPTLESVTRANTTLHATEISSHCSTRS